MKLALRSLICLSKCSHVYTNISHLTVLCNRINNSSFRLLLWKSLILHLVCIVHVRLLPGKRIKCPTTLLARQLFFQQICIESPHCACKELMQWRGSLAFISQPAFQMQVRDCEELLWFLYSALCRPQWSIQKIKSFSLSLFVCVWVSRQSWMVITGVLAAILLTSLIGNLIQVCGKCRGRPQQDYSYIPLKEVNRSRDSPKHSRTQPGKALFQPNDLDSQDSS